MCRSPKLGGVLVEVLDYQLAGDEDDEDEVAIEPRDSSCAALLFIRVPERKTTKNRIHLDLNPDDRDTEVARLEELGARRVDIGQGDVTWVVMADPEGNEFCVLTPRQS